MNFISCNVGASGPCGNTVFKQTRIYRAEGSTYLLPYHTPPRRASEYIRLVASIEGFALLQSKYQAYLLILYDILYITSLVYLSTGAEFIQSNWLVLMDNLRTTSLSISACLRALNPSLTFNGFLFEISHRKLQNSESAHMS